jgi:hypothetical protein
MQNEIDEFWRLYEQYYQICKDPNRSGSMEMHDLLASILAFLRSSSLESREGLAKCFIELVEGLRDFHSKASYTWDLIPFCMRELQWPEVKAAIDREIASNDLDVVSYLKKIRSAYEPVWINEDKFVYYVEKAKKEGRTIPPRYPPKLTTRIRRFCSELFGKKKEEKN